MKLFKIEGKNKKNKSMMYRGATFLQIGEEKFLFLSAKLELGAV